MHAYPKAAFGKSMASRMQLDNKTVERTASILVSGRFAREANVQPYPAAAHLSR